MDDVVREGESACDAAAQKAQELKQEADKMRSEADNLGNRISELHRKTLVQVVQRDGFELVRVRREISKKKREKNDLVAEAKRTDRKASKLKRRERDLRNLVTLLKSNPDSTRIAGKVTAAASGLMSKAV